MINWNIQEQDDGSYDITKGNRGFINGLESVSAALSRIRRSRFFSRDDKIIVTDKTGYVRKI